MDAAVSKVDKDGNMMNGDLDMGGNSATGLADPVNDNDTDTATKENV